MIFFIFQDKYSALKPSRGSLLPPAGTPDTFTRGFMRPSSTKTTRVHVRPSPSACGFGFTAAGEEVPLRGKRVLLSRFPRNGPEAYIQRAAGEL